MPRKGSYGLDYSDEYDAYDDYDDYSYDHEEGCSEPHKKKAGVWRCPICTFDNDENLPFCEICGVIREAKLGTSDKENADGVCEKPGASLLAKSLFSSNPREGSEDNAESLSIKENNFHGNTKFQARFAPFKFDSPSPDDIVFSGKKALEITQKKVKHLTESQISLVPAELQDMGAAENLERPPRLPSKDSHRNISEGGAGGSTGLANKLQDFSLSQTSEYKPEEWMLPVEEKGALAQLNLAIVGHVDSGKSTLSGRLLHQLGRISRKEMHKYEKESREKGKGSFAYAWAMDESSEERERGITMAVAVAYFDCKRYHVVLLDSPGHRDLVPNLIAGVVDSSGGNFEAGMEGGGQTREHAQLVRSFGVDQMIVAVNKMDCKRLGLFLRSCGFKESSISWVPLSAIDNQNLMAPASDPRLSRWYAGPCLLEAIDALQPPVRDVSKPLRLPVCDVIKSRSQGNVSASGKLEAGAIRNGTKVGAHALHRAGLDVVPCGEGGGQRGGRPPGVDTASVTPGGVLCHPDFPVHVAASLELKILTLDVATPILVGSEVEFHIHHVREAARVARIVSVVDPKTGRASGKAARFLSAKQSAVIEVVLAGAVCVEEFSKCRALGRVFLRSSGSTVAVGIVTKVLRQ
ncbi:unnamed protein product [Spirodela intermedia]|uniref:Uncharacterized protein n=1 Tax=Spirodela intermedia TaxID=51605 RepID=A0A7I8IJ67_SPIIN|nr:unnamed protein product [Spirodela intermedia]CAA6657939.1 unnamed protein product [Spirodela intermedia]